MRKLFAATALVLAGAGAALAADPVEGVWKTEVDAGAYAHIAIKPCGAADSVGLHRADLPRPDLDPRPVSA